MTGLGLVGVAVWAAFVWVGLVGAAGEAVAARPGLVGTAGGAGWVAWSGQRVGSLVKGRVWSGQAARRLAGPVWLRAGGRGRLAFCQAGFDKG